MSEEELKSRGLRRSYEHASIRGWLARPTKKYCQVIEQAMGWYPGTLTEPATEIDLIMLIQCRKDIVLDVSGLQSSLPSDQFDKVIELLQPNHLQDIASIAKEIRDWLLARNVDSEHIDMKLISGSFDIQATFKLITLDTLSELMIEVSKMKYVNKIKTSMVLSTIDEQFINDNL